MNWLGWSTLAFLGDLAGGLLGATAFALARTSLRQKAVRRTVGA